MKFLLAPALALTLLVGCAAPQGRIAPITLDDLRHFREARLAERLQARLVVSVKDERIDRYDADPKIVRELHAAGAHLADKVDMRLVEHYPIDALGLYVYVLEGDSVDTVDQAEQVLERTPDVKSVQRVNLFRTETSQPEIPDDISSNFYDDPLGPLQALPASELARLHEFATGEGVTIAIVDTGIDRNHEDLRNAKLDLRNLVDENLDAPVETHATAIAGIILAQPGNGIGISGIAPASRVILLRACWQESREDSAYCNTFTLAKALAAALEADVDIVNLSLTGPMDPLLVQLVEALQARNVIVVAANADEPGQGAFPSALPGVISATSRPVFAQDPGPVYAPGSDIITLLPENRYGLRDGSSISAAQVSGVAGLFRERDPVMTAEVLEGLLHGRGVEEEGLAGLLEALRKVESQQ